MRYREPESQSGLNQTERMTRRIQHRNKLAAAKLRVRLACAELSALAITALRSGTRKSKVDLLLLTAFLLRPDGRHIIVFLP